MSFTNVNNINPESLEDCLNPLSHAELVAMLVRLGVTIPAASDCITEMIANQQQRKIFVCRLSPETTSSTLHKVFSIYGKIAEAVVIQDSRSKRSRGFGFIKFLDPISAERALENPLKIIDGWETEAAPAIMTHDEKIQRELHKEREAQAAVAAKYKNFFPPGGPMYGRDAYSNLPPSNYGQAPPFIYSTHSQPSANGGPSRSAGGRSHQYSQPPVAQYSHSHHPFSAASDPYAGSRTPAGVASLDQYSVYPSNPHGSFDLQHTNTNFGNNLQQQPRSRTGWTSAPSSSSEPSSLAASLWHDPRPSLQITSSGFKPSAVSLDSHDSRLAAFSLGSSQVSSNSTLGAAAVPRSPSLSAQVASITAHISNEPVTSSFVSDALASQLNAFQSVPGSSTSAEVHHQVQALVGIPSPSISFENFHSMSSLSPKLLLSLADSLHKLQKGGEVNVPSKASSSTSAQVAPLTASAPNNNLNPLPNPPLQQPDSSLLNSSTLSSSSSSS